MTSEEYQQSIRELARAATMPEVVAARIEAELERAFGTARVANEPIRRVRRLVALAAAAAIIIAVGVAVWFTRQPVTQADIMAVAKAGITDAAGLTSGSPDPAHPKSAAAAATGRKPGAAHGAVAPRISRRSRTSLPPVIRPAGFVPVPAAAGLPQFESGVIVRVALPVTALPSYGVDISRASSNQPVEADVLLGQDGLARAIRLVNSSRSQQ